MKIFIFYFSFFFFLNKTLKIKIHNPLLSFLVSFVKKVNSIAQMEASLRISLVSQNFCLFIKLFSRFFSFFLKLYFLFFVFLSFHLSAYVAVRMPLFYSLTMKFAALTEHIFLIHKKIINNAYCNLVDPFIIQRKTSLSLSLITIRTRPFIPRVVR